MLYFYEKIDMQFELFSPYELKENKKRLVRNIQIWVCKALEENEINQEIFFDLCNQINSTHKILEEEFSLGKINEKYLSLIKVIEESKYLNRISKKGI